ncbi:hypothetical protein LguiB_030012 [Lonicera macranthoides]
MAGTSPEHQVPLLSTASETITNLSIVDYFFGFGFGLVTTVATSSFSSSFFVISSSFFFFRLRLRYRGIAAHRRTSTVVDEDVVGLGFI